MNRSPRRGPGGLRAREVDRHRHDLTGLPTHVGDEKLGVATVARRRRDPGWKGGYVRHVDLTDDSLDQCRVRPRWRPAGPARAASPCLRLRVKTC
jgi:hypothetical protein